MSLPLRILKPSGNVFFPPQAFSSTGTNLHLQFFPTNNHENGKTDRILNREYVDFDREIGRVHLKTRFILNGVCVVWRGWVDLQRLDGIGYVEFDEDKARVEDSVLRQSMDQQNRRLREFEERQRLRREELERQAEAEVEARRRGQPSPASTSGSSGGTNSSNEGCWNKEQTAWYFPGGVGSYRLVVWVKQVLIKGL